MHALMKYGIAISFFNTSARCICKVNLPAEYRLSILYLPIYLIGKRNVPYKYVIYRRCIVMIENWNYRFDWNAIFVSHKFCWLFCHAFLLTKVSKEKKGNLQMKHRLFMFAKGVGRFSPPGKSLLFVVSIFTLLWYESPLSKFELAVSMPCRRAYFFSWSKLWFVCDDNFCINSI